MAHFVYAIVTTNHVADQVQSAWPELIRFDAGDAHAIFPVDEDQIEKRLERQTGDLKPSETFIYLSDSFKEELPELSKYGKICYFETEYFGGEGGQGACVYENRSELMAPTWARSGTINDGLKIIGVNSSDNLDEFDTIGLGEVRKNADFSNRDG